MPVIDTEGRIQSNHLTEPERQARLALVVDDEPTVRKTIAMTLQSDCFRTLQASNGIEAFRLVEELKGQIDIVISDIRMPDGDGLELARSLSQQYPNIPLILVSGYTDVEGLSVNAVFLQKPFSPAQLKSLATKLCSRG